jgi:hypothetical protein
MCEYISKLLEKGDHSYRLRIGQFKFNKETSTQGYKIIDVDFLKCFISSKWHSGFNDKGCENIGVIFEF